MYVNYSEIMTKKRPRGLSRKVHVSENIEGSLRRRTLNSVEMAHERALGLKRYTDALSGELLIHVDFL